MAEGRIPLGQWAKAFGRAFPGFDEMVAVADAAWISPLEGRRRTFPYVKCGQIGFYWAESGRPICDHWYWLLEVEEEEGARP